MKRFIFFVAFLCVAMLISTKVNAQSAYQKAYAKAKLKANKRGDNISEVTNEFSSPEFRIEEVEHVEGPQLAKYCVVIGSFGLKANAEGLRNRLNNAGYNATIVRNFKKNMFRVVGMSSNDLQEANNMKMQINDVYPDSWLLCPEGYNYVDNGAQTQNYYANNNSIQSKPVSINQSDTNTTIPTLKTLSPVDKNIPTIDQLDRNTFAIVIGNEKYKNVAEVPFAQNDAKVFCEYVQKTLGIPQEQIKLVENATYNDFRLALNWLEKAMSICNGNGKAIVYYAGHGIPNELDNSAYLLPVDGIGNDPASGYSLTDFYQKLGAMQAKSITVFLDACFSGTKRDNGMLVAARGVAIKAKPSEPKGNMVVFSAAQGDETAYPYLDMQHGMFTYFLLKKLQETKGTVTLGELGDYIKDEVKRQSFLKNNKIQTPMVSVATSLKTKWKDLKLK